MTIIHRNENTRVVSGSALYLQPYFNGVGQSYQGNGLYLNQGGFIGIGGIARAISDIGKSGLLALPSVAQFAINNKELIKDGIEAGSHVVSTISNLKKASDEAEKLKLIKTIVKKKEKKSKQEKLTEEDKKLIDSVIEGATREANGLKRF
jgi:hypothetical protein